MRTHRNSNTEIPEQTLGKKNIYKQQKIERIKHKRKAKRAA